MMRPARMLLLVFAFVAVTTVALTATSTVPASRAGSTTAAVTANTLKPSQCAALTLGGTKTGSGTITVVLTTAWLILGSAGVDTVTGGNLADCILGGGGNDSIGGGGGNDWINGGAGTDVCIGGAGTDTFLNCETATQ